MTAEVEVYSFIEGESMIETPVNSVLKQVIIVNENQSLFKNGVQTYEVNLTSGIIFVMEDGLQISYEKNIFIKKENRFIMKEIRMKNCVIQKCMIFYIAKKGMLTPMIM